MIAEVGGIKKKTETVLLAEFFFTTYRHFFDAISENRRARERKKCRQK